jgi:hypothetical protein
VSADSKPQQAPEASLAAEDEENGRTSVISAILSTPIPEEEAPYKSDSTFKFTPTIYIKGQDEDKLSIGGWKIPVIDALCGSIQSNITNLSYVLVNPLISVYGTAVLRKRIFRHYWLVLVHLVLQNYL